VHARVQELFKVLVACHGASAERSAGALGVWGRGE
jgi:hypothetical protein